jgi:hypothetical protein
MVIPQSLIQLRKKMSTQNKQLSMFQVKRQLATIQSVKTAYGDIDISQDLTILAALEKLLFRHLKKVIDDAFESGEQLDWLQQQYSNRSLKEAHSDLAKKELQTSGNGGSLDGEVVLDNPRLSGDGNKNANTTKKKLPPKGGKE